jgi:hypothetical protein
MWTGELTINGAIADIIRFVIGSVYLAANEPLSERLIATAAQVPGNQ